MSLLARHRYLISRITDTFELEEIQTEEMMLVPDVLLSINTFFSAEGSSKIIITLEDAPVNVVKSSRMIDSASASVSGDRKVSQRCLRIHTEAVSCQTALAIFFMKIKKSKDGDDKVAIDPAKSNDGSLSFGIIRNPLETLELMMRCVYRPMMQDLNTDIWGEATIEQRNEFVVSMDTFIRGLQDNIRNLSAGIELTRPDARLDSMGISVASANPVLVTSCMNLLYDWCRNIESYLDDSSRSKWENADSGPDTELSYWRNRLQRLTSITEQLKSKYVKNVVSLLSVVLKQGDATGVIDITRATSLLAQWREIDVHITEAANEAKDNVKYLSTLERFFDPLSGNDPSLVIDTLPAMLNALKMVHTIARYFGTTERMTKLFMKFSNQMISCCKLSIVGRNSSDIIWSLDPAVLLERVELCLRLNEEYQDDYRKTKESLVATPKSRQFDFSEVQIFGKFDLFCRRLIKLMDMFSQIKQFKALAAEKFEGLDPLLASYNEIVRALRLRGHDLLDFHNNHFDRDFVIFTAQMNELEGSLQIFIDKSFEHVGGIDKALELLKRYQRVLNRETIRRDLDSKMSVIFHNYGLELNEVEIIYEKQKTDPPLARNMTPIAGNISWVRHLLRRIEDPMDNFRHNTALLSSRESRKIIKTYNKVARTLTAYEYLWYEAWCNSIESARAGLQATLIIRHEESGKLFVNFDRDILQLIREAKCLSKLEINVPENAKIVLLQEQNFKAHYDDLRFALSEYDRVVGLINPITREVVKPHLQAMEQKLRPGMITLTWTSMNIDTYKTLVMTGLSQLEELITKINDIVEYRIQKKLIQFSKSIIVDMPDERAVALDEFVMMQETAVKTKTAVLASKNLEIETAVDDLINLVSMSSTESGESFSRELKRLHAHYKSLTYQAMRNSIKRSLNILKTRTAFRSTYDKDSPFFEVDVQLSVPSVRLSPSLDDIQKAINRASVAVILSAKQISLWNQSTVIESERRSFFEYSGCDVEILKTVLLLTGALHGTRNLVHDYLKQFSRYDWLWKDDKELAYKRFVAKNPSIDDFEQELKKFLHVEEEIASLEQSRSIGALVLNTSNIKLQLRSECGLWKVLFSNKLHQKAKDSAFQQHEYIRQMMTKLNVEVNSLDSLRYKMSIIAEIRSREASIVSELNPIVDLYTMLGKYMPEGLIEKDELDQMATMLPTWRKLLEYADEVTANLSSVQGSFKKALQADIRDFIIDTKSLRAEFDAGGPLIPGLNTTVAISLLKKYKETVKAQERKMETYVGGEELFALRPTRFDDISKVRKDINLIDQLYSLYQEAMESFQEWEKMQWIYVAETLEAMTEYVSTFDARCRKLPVKLREYPAYDFLRSKLNEFQVLLPMLANMIRPSMKPRHWVDINKLVSNILPIDSDGFSLSHILNSALVTYKDDVEEICLGADKQLQLEVQIHDLKLHWGTCAFEFTTLKNRDVFMLKAFGPVVEDLEEAQMLIQSLLSVRHVTPFKEELSKLLSQLSDSSDTLELWIKVQMLWTSLESVFLGGDIAKQMPIEAKKFGKINKDWEKLMFKASETKLVIPCCSNESLKVMLPIIYNELEKCQKSLEGYLEQKRNKFPRFYFVSNPVLLLILSQGSDPMQIQPHYEKLFDSINQVVHNKLDKSIIVEIQSSIGDTKETVALSKPVKCVGTIEDWLGELEKEMQKSLKKLCEIVSIDCATLPLRKFVEKNCGQFALLGIQLNWTQQCSDALNNAKANKLLLSEVNKQQAAILSDLSQWCLEDLGSVMNRIKVETLVTVQVHQRDVFAELLQLYKERKLKDATDFDWLKQTRFSWHVNGFDIHGEGACFISICDVDYKYNYEYLGCKDRLVITPLTDRCFITLSQAMGMCLGGAPSGPAGTGKTETVKDLGRTIGVFVVVTNCTDQQRYTDMAKIFKGLCQAGLWGCFDEFNRIELPVLSVVAQQVLTITNAKRSNSSSFIFPGDTQEINFNNQVGYFITMNPGYQGRQELPENLKSLFRGVAMMVPQREVIIKVKLCSVGYQRFPELARKFAALYNLCEQQLSKQKHYDFGLRNILSVLRAAGQIKRSHTSSPEDSLLMSTLRDMNLSKLVAQDVPLFLSLISDLFPGVTSNRISSQSDFTKALEAVVEEEHLILHPAWRTKVIQLYETTSVRHGIMMVGPSGSGKSRIIHCLQEILTRTTGIAHKRSKINPKAITSEMMFGETDKLSGEWVDGIFAVMWAKFNDRSRKDIHWIICDGPVDALWIENLNTVLDDNKILTLANGDRIPMSDNVKLVFEVEDLRNASPATVSRAGIIFVSESDLDWEPVLKSWIILKPQNYSSILTECFRKFIGCCDGPNSFGHLFHFLSKQCKQVIQCPRVGVLKGCCELLDALIESCDLAASGDILKTEIERIFLYCLTWAVGGILETEDRIKFSTYIEKIAAGSDAFPVVQAGDTIFEYKINHDSLEWEKWVAPHWEYPAGIQDPDFSSLFVPTVESTRASYILSHVHKRSYPTLLIGDSGTSKTATVLMFFNDLLLQLPEAMKIKKFSFSSATTLLMFQTSLDAELDKRGGKSFGPPGGKRMTIFLDDLHMPEKNDWGDQPTLELVRQLLETNNICFLDKDKRGDLKTIEDVDYVAAMGHPIGGRNDIPNRLKRHFFIFNLIPPSSRSINEIYGQMLSGKFTDISKTLKSILTDLPDATVSIWNSLRSRMLPSPTKFHYIFNLRDLSRVFQGILHIPRYSISSTRTLVSLWRHECSRVFADKLTNLVDINLFNELLDTQTRDLVLPILGTVEIGLSEKPLKSPKKSEQALKKSKTMSKSNVPIAVSDFDEEIFFIDFLKDDEVDDEGVLIEAQKQYELGGSLEDIRERCLIYLSRYNETYPSRVMNLVLFDDALRHLMRISRCLNMTRGNILLVGVGGSGKQSLARLASFCSGHALFQITISKSYSMNNLMDDLRAMYKSCGKAGTKMTFLFTEAEIKEESFMEVINSILTTGEIANLFPKDELIQMASELRNIAVKQIPNFVDTPDNLIKFFLNRAISNLHVVLCMSPVNAKFPERARRFPGIIAGCTIDWFLPWPKEALIAVSNGFINDITLDCSDKVRDDLIVYMGTVHQLVMESCEEYFQKMRRHVYQTPKTFLSFLSDYCAMYAIKSAEIVNKASRVEIGLDKLKAGAMDVEKMKVVLVGEDEKLRVAESSTNEMLKRLEISAMAAKKEENAVTKIRSDCQEVAARITKEKADAEEDLAKAQPFVEEAEAAVGSIKPSDLSELKKLAKPSDIIRLIFDCVALLRMDKLVRVEPMEVTMGVGKEKKTFMFIRDSFKFAQTGMLSDARFLNSIFQFSRVEKDFINDETVELMMPYLNLEGFTAAAAKNASKAAEGLCTWCRAMAQYHEASKIVKPKLEALAVAVARLEQAEGELFRSEMILKACQDTLANLQKDFDDQIAMKYSIEANALSTKKRMELATALIQGLSGERQRWKSDREEFAETKRRLVGDVALACAFVSYCGGFNQDFREYLVNQRLTKELKDRKIPFTNNMDLTEFLADIGIIGDWNLEGLPTDPLSIQNGILVTRSSRYPLLIDPQGQALRWICKHEEKRMANFGVSLKSSPRFRDQLEYCLAEGKTLIVVGIEEEIDPMLNPILEKQITVKGKTKYVTISGKVCDYADEFSLYMVTRLPNPHFSPEDQSKCAIVDFTVTQRGLEDQLLGRVIQKEQRSLEESLKSVLEEVTSNTKALIRLDQMLLERLSENTGNLLDDEELINVLADTKQRSTDVKEKLVSAAEMRKSINLKREQYRPVATRGSVIYFAIVDMANVNCMYQTSLDQFQILFDSSIDIAEKSTQPAKRVNNIVDTMTYNAYRYINRGLYESDKMSFKLILAFKILIAAEKLEPDYVNLFLRGGGSIDINLARVKPISWLPDEAWLNTLQIAQSIVYFKDMPLDMEINENAYLSWYNNNEPEKFTVPVLSDNRYAPDDEIIAAFNRLLIVRCLRPDRTILAVTDFFRSMETIILPNGAPLPAMGPKYVTPVTDSVESVLKEMESTTPVIYLLSAGADPTDAIETLARRKRKGIECVSMGEGQDVVAQRAIDAATLNGSWVLLQNCHLGLSFMDTMEAQMLRLKTPEANCSPDFRLFITTEPNPKFSIGLLQISSKVTNEPPKGLRAGLQRAYTVMVDQDRIDRIETSVWRNLLFTLCFVHSTVQERRKFGPLGWCIPYEFNDGDLHASIVFMEKHLEFAALSWTTLQFMVGEVQYGGRITDDMDRRLFNGYMEAWMSPITLQPSFAFSPDRPINKSSDNFQYAIRDYAEIGDYLKYIQSFPDIDSPEIFGMHPNADLTFRFKEANLLLNTILETQPKQSDGSAAGLTREDVVLAKCSSLMDSLPSGFSDDEIDERISSLGGFEQSLNIFLFQEVQRLQATIVKVRNTLTLTSQAIRGEVVCTTDIMRNIDAIFNARVPPFWLYSAAGDELSWQAPNLGIWFGGLLSRESQNRAWLSRGRPNSFWITGFFNPQGFLTAVQQEITRSHKQENWALDSMTLHSEFTDIANMEGVKAPPKEGVFIHGLFMDGAAWSAAGGGTIVESQPKKLFASMPVVYITAVTKQAKKSSTADYGPFGGFDCPVYKYPTRTDRYLVFIITLPSRENRPLHWILRGVALLCTTG